MDGKFQFLLVICFCLLSVHSNIDFFFQFEQMQHPSALNMFDEIINASKGKQIVMFLDYDGTLSPIVADPDRAFMSESVSLSLCLKHQ